MRREEIRDGAIDPTPVVGPDEAVPRVIEGEVGDLLLALLQRGNELLAFADGNPRIAMAVRNEHRRGDAVDAMDWRDAREQRRIALRVAVFRRAVLAAPCARTGEQRDEVGDAIVVDRGAPQL